ncbi:MAG: EamA family transporter [Pseudomonadota bacterium]
MDIAKPAGGPREPTARDWLYLSSIAVFGGSSFSFIRLGVETLEPATLAAGRMWVGAVLLLIIMVATGRSLPPLLERTEDGARIDPRWRFMAAVGVVGYAIPFFLFPWGQQTVPSGLAGIFMAFMPLATIALAHAFTDEKLSVRKGVGFLIGFSGILMLIGPDALSGVASGSLLAQLAILTASVCYAVAAVITRRAPPMQARSFSAGAVLIAATLLTPIALAVGSPLDGWTPGSVTAVLFLGLFPTGLNALLIILLVRSAGPGFMAFSNYITPLIAVGLGAAAFGERLQATSLFALAVILAGLAVSRSGRNGARRRPL